MIRRRSRIGRSCRLWAALLWHCGCFRQAMLDLALSVLALVAGGLALELYAAAGSLMGPQNEHGFSPGNEAWLHAAACLGQVRVEAVRGN